MILLLISTINYSQVTEAAERQAYLDKELPKTIEKYKKTQLPDYYVPLFKVINRF